jgi:hypothetical protein
MGSVSWSLFTVIKIVMIADCIYPYPEVPIIRRKESMRKVTEKQLSKAGIFYDLLIMGIGGGPRYLINDKKPDGEIACFSFSPDRNAGIKDIEIL